MSDHIAEMLGDIDTRIAKLTEMREGLLQFQREFPHTAASLTRADVAPTAATKRKYTKRRGTPGPKKRGPYKTKKKTALRKRTNERTNEARRAPAGRSLPDGAVDRPTQILGILDAHNGSMQPSKLMKAVKAASLATLRYWMAPLLTSGKVIATGKTAGRRFSLPGRVPKEEL